MNKRTLLQLLLIVILDTLLAIVLPDGTMIAIVAGISSCLLVLLSFWAFSPSGPERGQRIEITAHRGDLCVSCVNVDRDTVLKLASCLDADDASLAAQAPLAADAPPAANAGDCA